MKHRLLYDPRHLVPANSNWTHQMLFWISWARLLSFFACGFPPWGKEEEELATIWSSPLFFDSQFTMNGGIQCYYGSNVNFINCVSLTSQEHNYSEIFCLLDFVGALVNQFSLLRMILRKRIQHSNWCECMLLAFTFSNVTLAHMSVASLHTSNRRWVSLFIDAWDCI